MQGLGQVMASTTLRMTAGRSCRALSWIIFMPRAIDLPPMTLIDRPVPSPTNPLGAKGVGEAGATGAVRDHHQCVIDALRPLGVHTLDLPYTPHRIWQAIRQAGGVKHL